MSDELDRAYGIVREIVPDQSPEGCCILVAAAVAGLRGLSMRHIKVGALYWPSKFEADGDTWLAIHGGWGIWSHSPSTGEIVLHEENLDEDGGFRGHTWLQTADHSIVDLMHGVDGVTNVLYEDFPNVVAAWIRRPKLEKLVKSFWSDQMKRAMRLGRERAP